MRYCFLQYRFFDLTLAKLKNKM